MSAARALRAIHFPSALEEVAPARRRLAYDELLCLQLALRLRNDENLLGVPAHAHQAGEHVERLRAALPFRLSDEQEGAAGEILADMASPERIMNRLLLGDVGTGKTAVALFALAAVADSGTQAAVMAPTGVLAQQYAVKCGPVLDAIGVSWALVTGSTPASERARAAAGLPRARSPWRSARRRCSPMTWRSGASPAWSSTSSTGSARASATTFAPRGPVPTCSS